MDWLVSKFGWFLLPVVLVVGCNSNAAGGSVNGNDVYDAACARCHGPGGRPDASMVARLGVRDLTEAGLQARLSDADIRDRIIRGSANRQMPAFAGALSDEQVDAVIRHVRTLSSSKAPGESP